VELWAEKVGQTEVTVAQLAELSDKAGLFAWLGMEADHGRNIRFGKMISRYRQRCFGAWQILELGDKRPARYALRHGPPDQGTVIVQ
jgi:hypothetical protein